MPIDKHPTSSTQKPFTPALSSNFRNVKSPLTPRLAGSAPTSPAIAAKREAFVRALSPGAETLSPHPINENITPRSGIRKFRIGTESPSTPGSQRDSVATRPRATTSGATGKPATPQQHGLGITSPQRTTGNSTTPTTTTSTSVYTVHRKLSGTKSVVDSKEETTPKFFRADHAKSVIGSSATSERSIENYDNSPFFYLGGQKAQASQSSIAVSATETRNERTDKFFRAGDTVVQSISKPSNRPVLQTNRSFASALSAKSQSNDGRHQTGFHARSPSPSKSRRLIATQPSSPRLESREPLSISNTPSRDVIDRRKSISSSSSNTKLVARPEHRKSISAGSLQNTPIREQSIIQPSSASQQEKGFTAQSNVALSVSERTSVSLISPDALSTRSFSLTSSNILTTSLKSDTDQSEVPKRLRTLAVDSNETTSPQSPGPVLRRLSTSHSVVSQPDDAAHARRERKVLDLEISNSSLLAINKTLEKELRKQNSELRRFRRLSRSGRLSLAPTDRTVSASTLGTVAEMHDEDDDLSNFEEDSDLDNVDEEEASMLSNDSSSVLSPGGKSRQRLRDEKRLMLDLSKHQEMLIDSQKLSQSIRRCLTCTEELIREANKALEYRVGIGDVKIGGRVLSHDELEDKAFENGENEVHQNRQGLLSPSLKSTTMMDADKWFELHADVVSSSSKSIDLHSEHV